MSANESATSGTKIEFVLEDELTPEEAERFFEAAAEAGAPNATEHFLDLTLRLPTGPRPLPPSGPAHQTSHPKAA